eukprot:465053_1
MAAVMANDAAPGNDAVQVLSNSHLKWRIHKKKTRVSWSYQSKIFELWGIKWYLKCWRENQKKVAVYFVLDKKYPSNVKKISFKCRCNVVVGEEEVSLIREIEYTSWGSRTETIYPNNINNKNLYNKQIFSAPVDIDVEIEVPCIINVLGEEVTGEYINKTAYKKQIQFNEPTQTQLDRMEEKINNIENVLKMIQIQLQMNEEQKMNHVDNVENIVKVNKDKSDKQMFRHWVQNVLKLPEYYNIFVDNGAETLSVIQMFGMNELEMIGITKIGHKMQILKEIQKLQEPVSYNKPQEGGTAYI